MDVVRTAVSFIGAEDPDEDDSPNRPTCAKSIAHARRCCPRSSPYDKRRRRGLAPIAPHSDLGYAANFLQMCFGEVPSPMVVKAFEQSMILYAEHSFNASTFAARVVTSTLVRHLLRGRPAPSARSRARCTAARTRRSCTT